MTDKATAGSAPRRFPIHLWVVGIVALLWNAMGAFDYLATQLELEFYMSKFTPEQLSFFSGFPVWAVSGWALGVWGAFFGSIALLMRMKCSVWAFAVSLAGMIVSSIYSLGLSNGIEIMGTGSLAFSALIWIVGIFLLVYARRLAATGVLR